MLLPKLGPVVAYGGDYNPEQWPESVWPEDVRLMRAASVNLVSVGIFSWAKLQPGEDAYDFGWLDRVMDLLAGAGIKVCLATATASPPPWLTAKYPEARAVDANGVPHAPGSRQHYSPSSPDYRRLAAALVRRFAERYARHPALAAWHVNNEYACHMQECHGAASTAAFRAWLRNRYGSLDALNHAWGTAFWSQTYHDWDEILTPRRSPYHNNPAQQLDFRRFTSDAFLELYLMEKAILNELAPDVPVTTNLMGFFKPLNYFKWAEHFDFAAWDSYPDPLAGHAATRAAAAAHDLTRSLKRGLPWVLMEQAPSAVNWRPVNPPKPPGAMRLQSLQALARGADGVMFFQWRASQAGAEKFHSGMVPHGDPKKSRVFREVSALGAELAKLAPLCGARVRARAAILFDWANWWAVELESHPSVVDYQAWVKDFHRYFFDRNLAVDFAPPGADLSGYSLVVAPALYLLRREDAAKIEAFVRGGGTLVATYFSGIVDENDRVALGGYPAWLRAALGLWIEEFAPLGPGQANVVRFADGREFPGAYWSEVVHLEGARPLASFTQDFFAGGAAATEHDFGRGRAYYLAAKFDADGIAALLDPACQRAGIAPLLSAPENVEVSLREARDGGRYLFVLNHNSAPVSVALGRFRGAELLTGREAAGTLELAPLGAVIVKLIPEH